MPRRFTTAATVDEPQAARRSFPLSTGDHTHLAGRGFEGFMPFPRVQGLAAATATRVRYLAETGEVADLPAGPRRDWLIPCAIARRLGPWQAKRPCRVARPGNSIPPR